VSARIANLAAVVLAAGRGRRLGPLTSLRPKPLCPVGSTTGLDAAMDRLGGVGLCGPDLVAVNAHHLADQILDAVSDRAHVSVELPEPLGSAGAVGALRDWASGRDLLICNGDAYFRGDPLGVLLDGWSGERPRLLTVRDPLRADFGDRRFAGVSLLPARIAARLAPVRSSLLDTAWSDAEFVDFADTFIDCGTPRDYLAANLDSSRGASVVGAGAVVRGRLTRSVVWPKGIVGAGEHLVDAIRTDTGVTVLVNDPSAPDPGSSSP
jgi:MurNAc alpha-1-phosphate uridylyltransferase